MWPPRPPPAWLLLTWTLIATATCCHTWRPCTDLQPLDLLSRALPPPGQAPPPPGLAPPPQGQAPPPQVQVVQSRGSRGLRLGGPPLSFPSSQIFTECYLFPTEFSLVATLRTPRPGPQVGEFLFSVVADGSGSLVLGLRVFPDRVQLLLEAPGGGGPDGGAWPGRGLLTFGGLDLRDGGWHTLVLAVSGKHATLTTDCGPARELLLVRPFPAALSTQQTRFFIGSRGRGRGRFSGLLRQLVLLPGADARPRLCYHGYQPGLEELAVPQVLKSALLQPDQPGPLYPYEAEARVTAGNRPRCSGPELGQLWLDARNQGLFICDGRSWRPLLHTGPERLDYLEDYQDLYTHSETFDMEVFSIPSEGLFLAAANRDPRLGSGIYRWRNGSFQLFQNISTQGARAWKHFSIQHQVFLVVAEVGGAEPERSAIFRWHRRRRRFARFQTLQTHAAQDWEFFRIHNNSFLVVANHRQGSRHNIDSVIYRWNPHSQGRGLSGGRGLLTFGGLDLRDGGWHTLVLAVSGKHATLTTDCGPARELLLVRPFPSSLSTQQTRFFIGSRGRGRGRFSGLLRQLVLLPGADARPRLCYHGYQPGLEELAVPQVLKSAPLQPDQPGPLYPYEAEARVTAGNRPRCSGPELGQLWLDARNRGLFICDGRSWRPLLHRPERLDYLEDYQDLYTHSETFDMEVFSIPSEGLFLAAANRDPRLGSGIYRWRNGSFQLFQNISTQGARAWKSFSIQHQVFLVVAEVGGAEPERSAIFRWHRRRRRFALFQTLQTHAAQDWEFFRIHNNSFLVVANHRQGSRHNIDSVIYRWNPHSQLFELNQTLPTLGAYDWEFFEVGPFHFLAVANTFDGRSTVLSSTVYVWQDGRFRTFQNITTVGATDWEFFQIGGRFFLAVANSQQVSVGRSLYSLNSTVYELHAGAQAFLRFQDIPTHSALDWEFFTVGEQNFLVVANSHDGSSYSLNSVVYRWQGYEGFVPVHVLPTFGCRDWEHFRTPQGSFLLYSSATSRLSKVFRLRTY
ncbi:thrombospondin-type laminin G domain and EAR repeat-containing protein-like [Menidia menidia]